MIITNALDMFNSLYDKKLESNYLWSFNFDCLAYDQAKSLFEMMMH